MLGVLLVVIVGILWLVALLLRLRLVPVRFSRIGGLFLILLLGLFLTVAGGLVASFVFGTVLRIWALYRTWHNS